MRFAFPTQFFVWRQCGPKAGWRSRPRPQPRAAALAAAGCPDACFCRLRPLGSGSMARDYLPGKRPSCCGRKPLELEAPPLLGGCRLLRAKVTQHEQASVAANELEEREGAALWAERAPRRLGPSGQAPGLCPKPQESRLQTCSDLVGKLPGFQENPIYTRTECTEQTLEDVQPLTGCTGTRFIRRSPHLLCQVSVLDCVGLEAVILYRVLGYSVISD